MRSPFKKLFFVAASLSFFLSSCGQEVCVSGIGKCEVPEDIASKQETSKSPTGPSPVKTLKVGFITDRMSVPQGEQITLAGIGGEAPYTFTLTTDPATGKVGENDGIFTAPRIKTTAKVKITDKTKTSVEIQIDIP